MTKTTATTTTTGASMIASRNLVWTSNQTPTVIVAFIMAETPAKLTLFQTTISDRNSDWPDIQPVVTVVDKMSSPDEAISSSEDKPVIRSVDGAHAQNLSSSSATLPAPMLTSSDTDSSGTFSFVMAVIGLVFIIIVMIKWAIKRLVQYSNVDSAVQYLTFYHCDFQKAVCHRYRH